MGSLDTALGADAAAMLLDFGEPWVYTPKPVGGVVQPSINITPVVDRHQPEVIKEGQKYRVKMVSMFIAASPAGGLTTRPERGDKLVGPWQIQDTPTTFRITAIISQDLGGWTIHAEAAMG
ncbi:MAG TPA: hypothetical protein VK797_22820 [Tepidisphaeraceae bacterium]|jgi:hypothetical protein|nr:hypothetical protein [Tepidisphaeraceae bacterium]